MAATLAVPAGAVSGRSAAALHEFPGWKRSRVEVCTRHGTTHRSPFGDVRETQTVGRLTVVHGIRAVSPADCIVQLAACVGAATLDDLVDDVARTRRQLLPELRDRYVALAHSRLPGIGNVRAALEARGDGYVPPASQLERHLREVLAAAGPPSVALEATPPWLERSRQRVDAVVPEWRLVVEGDGRDWHTRVRDFERDRWRDTVALANGYATVRFTWHQLVHRATWCRNALVAIGADRSGSGGRLATA